MIFKNLADEKLSKQEVISFLVKSFRLKTLSAIRSGSEVL